MKMYESNKNNYLKFDLVVAGGGMAGICASLAAARLGVNTVLIHDRPVLGGNASSEIKMHICGADRHGTIKNARETGIIEELLLKNRSVNYNHSFSIQDVVLWEACSFQENLTLMLNAKIIDVVSIDNKIINIKAYQSTTEKDFTVFADYFIDATGNGYLGYKSEAKFMFGREGKNIFDEPDAPLESDKYVMGNTIMFTANNTGYKIPFNKPFWAYDYSETDLKYRCHNDITSGYWWIEAGGDLNTINDGEIIRDELIKMLFGVWDHIKNKDHKADNYVLDWIGFLPGMRESRRIIGDYVLKQQDLMNKTSFYDTVAYGGWTMDLHTKNGMGALCEPPNNHIDTNGLYEIPYRCLYSINIENLFMAGRDISVSHIAMGSTRVMATCAVIGQAVGTAVFIAKKNKTNNKGVLRYIKDLQQQLLEDDCYLPNVIDIDKDNKALNCKISSSSYIKDNKPEKVINGISRDTITENAYISDKISKYGEWLEFAFDKPEKINKIIIKFDSDLSNELTITINEILKSQQKGFPKNIVKDYNIEFFIKGEMVEKKEIRNNILRLNKINFNNILCDKIKINCLNTYGADFVKIFEVKIK